MKRKLIVSVLIAGLGALVFVFFRSGDAGPELDAKGLGAIDRATRDGEDLGKGDPEHENTEQRVEVTEGLSAAEVGVRKDQLQTSEEFANEDSGESEGRAVIEDDFLYVYGVGQVFRMGDAEVSARKGEMIVDSSGEMVGGDLRMQKGENVIEGDGIIFEIVNGRYVMRTIKPDDGGE